MGMSEGKREADRSAEDRFRARLRDAGAGEPVPGDHLPAVLPPPARHYGLGEGATQRLFAKSYLAWSFKPIIGFLIDAYGRTRTLLIGLLGVAALGFLVTPLLDTGPMVFFGLMFGLSVVLAGTDVAIDRATVIAGDEEAKATGRSRATTVGLNQAICWLSIYGTSIAGGGRWAATSTEHVPFKGLLVALAGVPLLVLLFVLRLPRDTAAADPARAVDRAVLGGTELGADSRHHAVLLPDSLPAAARPDLLEPHDRRRCTSPRRRSGSPRRRQRRLLRGRGVVRLEGRRAGRSASVCASCFASTSWSASS